MDNVEELEAIVDQHTAAVFVEPVQGEGGVNPVSPQFMQKIKKICDQNQALLVMDEVQCGLGRTGKLFAYEWLGVKPDIMTLAKALGNGVPIGAVLATDKVAASFQPGDHASTFGGNHLSTAVGCKVLEIMTAPDFLSEVEAKGKYFQSRLQDLAVEHGFEGQVRGLGLMIGLPVGEKGPAIVDVCYNRGLLINCVGGHILRFLPPLTVSKDEIDQALGILEEAFCC